MKRQLWMVSFSIGASVLAARAWAQAPGETTPAGGGSAGSGSAGSAEGSGAGPGSAAGSAAGSGDGSGAGSAKNSAAGDNLKAQESLPQVTAARGGSFGIPSSIQTAGLHAAVDAQLFDDKSNTDAFAQLAGLKINDRVTVDVVGQSVTQDMQRFVLADNTVKPEMYVASLSSAGMRIRIRGQDVLLVSRLQNQDCLDALAQTVHDEKTNDEVSFFRLIGNSALGLTASGKVDPARLQTAKDDEAKAQQKVDEAQKVVNALDALASAKGVQMLDAAKTNAKKEADKGLADAQAALAKAKSDTAAADAKITTKDRDGNERVFMASDLNPKLARVKSACKLDEIKGVGGKTLTLGAHALRRSSNTKDGKASVGGALEAMVQRDSLNSTAYVGLSFEYLNHAMDKDSGAQFDFASFHALRLSAGYEYRGSHTTDGSDLLPRVGVYGVASYGWWHDNYTFASAGGTVDDDVHSTELEAGLYAGGKFTNNFTGMLALRVLKPFGDFNQGTTFIISLIPAVSAGK